MTFEPKKSLYTGRGPEAVAEDLQRSISGGPTQVQAGPSQTAPQSISESLFSSASLQQRTMRLVQPRSSPPALETKVSKKMRIHSNGALAIQVSRVRDSCLISPYHVRFGWYPSSHRPRRCMPPPPIGESHRLLSRV